MEGGRDESRHRGGFRDLLGLQVVPVGAWMVAGLLGLGPLVAVQATRAIRDH